ncbi:MAG: ABC transporter permease [Phycisphaeraceae bacterium]|nr:ABC transporter permease [Phycisphaeraceae bacterium]
MFRTLCVAWREFCSTVFTKGYLLGVVIPPAIMVVALMIIPLLKSLPGPRVSGTLAVVDHSGAVAGRIVERFSAEGLAQESAERKARTEEQIAEGVKQLGLDAEASKQANETASAAAAKQSDDGAQIAVEVLSADTHLDPILEALKTANPRVSRGEESDGPRKERIALVVIPDASVTPGPDGQFAGFDLFVASKLDFEVQQRLTQRVQGAIVDTRLAADPRLREARIDPAQVRQLLERPRAETKAMTASGAQKTSEIASVLVPAGFMLLLLMSVMTGGQYLLTTTIEEKGSRVMEVLLSAVSPLQLMTGKILGQMAASLLLLLVYSGLMIASLITFSLYYLLNPMNVVYLVIFFFIAFFTIASFMAAVGSSVNELREAQTLMTPVMLVVMTPWLLWMPISRAPNSLFATIMSFIPVLNPFVMVIRLAGSEPVPGWQIPLSIAVGVGTACIAAWAAAKVFRVGVLMYGKPPNLKTLAKWVRMA